MMGRGVPEQRWRKGPWTPEEDKLLSEYVKLHGEGRWSSVPRCAALNRNGKSCRLRWVNYLRPGLKRGQLTPQEEGIIIELHAFWGNKWSTIARYLPGRTDNEIKNYWRTHFKKKKDSSQKREKPRAQFLKQKRQQQQQEQLLLLEHDMKMVNTSHDHDRMHNAQGKQEMPIMYSNLEDQYLGPMSQDVASWADSVTEDWLWGGLWNLDDPQGHVDRTSNCNKIAVENQAISFPFEGDPNNVDGGGYIF